MLPFPVTTALTGLAPSATTTVYATYRTTGDLQAYLTTAVPSTPYEVVGTVTTTATGVASVDNSTAPATTTGRRHRSEYPAAVGLYFSTGARIDASTFGVIVNGVFEALPGNPVNAPNGARLGGTAIPTQRFFVRAHRSADFTVPDATWTAVPFDFDQVMRTDYTGAPDYPNPPHNDSGSVTVRSRFYVGPAGAYHLSGRAQFVDPAGANVGRRYSRIVLYNASGVPTWFINCDNKDVLVQGSLVAWEAVVDMPSGFYVEFQVHHTQGAPLALSANSYSGGTNTYATMTLLQVA
jgi:hypothetical protein